MKIIFKLVNSLPFLLIIYVLLGMNVRLYYSPENNEGINIDLYKQLQYLKSRRADDASLEMQQLFPEGLMFFECLYGLAWADFISGVDAESGISKEGLSEIEDCLKVINLPSSRSIFQGDTKLKFGAFYTGWSNYLLGRKLEVLTNSERSNEDINNFKNNCSRISKALTESENPFLESYSHNCWPADVTICVATLALHDRIFEKQYDEVIKDWVNKIKRRLDSNGLIPHSAQFSNGKTLEEARGESQSLILSFLPEIDSSFSKKQYQKFKELFVEKRLGLNAIREYPKGKEGEGDIDSGPVIWGIGTAATIVAQKAAQNNGDYILANQIQNGIEALGFPKTNDSGKYFLYGYLDIGDVFIAWTRSSENENFTVDKPWWQFPFHLWSLLIIIPCLFVLFQTWKSNIEKGRLNNSTRTNFLNTN